MDEEDRTKDRRWCQVSLAIGIANVFASGYDLDFYKIELYPIIPNGVDRLSDKNILVF